MHHLRVIVWCICQIVASARTGRPPRSRCGGVVVVLEVSEAKRRTPQVVVRVPRTAPLSAENWRHAVAALTVMIDQWWTKQSRCRGWIGSARRRCGGRPVMNRCQGVRRRTAGSVTIGP
jgi:hypothetical protein